MLQITAFPSPNFNKRSEPIDTLVLHYTGMATGEAAVARLCDPAAAVSAHYVVFEDGKILRLVDEEKRAWHAGKSLWREESEINSRSIGIEIVNPGHEYGYRPFPDEQIAAVIDLCRDILDRRFISPNRIVAHSDIAPTRKSDPGELFPWKRLAEKGIGLWTDEFLPARDSDRDMLLSIGYDVSDEQVALKAFQRRFYPEALLNGSKRTTERLAAVEKLYHEKGKLK